MRAAAIAVLAGLACGTALAQQANVNLDYNPQKNTENMIPFSAPFNSPDVRDDRTVTFRLKAPEARTVSLAGVAILTALRQEKPVPFQKGADGVWSLTVGPLRPDMYAYHLVVDGVQVADPNNTVAAFTAMPSSRSPTTRWSIEITPGTSSSPSLSSRPSCASTSFHWWNGSTASGPPGGRALAGRWAAGTRCSSGSRAWTTSGATTGHDWASWRHLVYSRFPPGLWRTQAPAEPAPRP